jgi:hypothetical protein
MSDRYSTEQKSIVDRDNRNMAAAGIPMSDEIINLWASIDAGSIGITATAIDVDSLALGGGHFSRDADTTTGLTFGYKAGRFHNGLTVVSVSAGTIALSASNTNYVEVNRAGTVSANTSAFTSGSLPLYTVVCGSEAISTVTVSKPLMTLIGSAGVVGSMLSTAGATKEFVVLAGTLSATGDFVVPLPNVAGTISRIGLVVETTVAANDTDYWTFGVVNKGAAGGGTAVVVDATAAANSTKATGGSACTAYVQRDLTLTGVAGDKIVTAKNVLLVTCTKAASGADLVGLAVVVELTFTA